MNEKILTVFVFSIFLLTIFVNVSLVKADDASDFDITFGWFDENNDGFIDVEYTAENSLWSNKGMPYDEDENTLVTNLYFNEQEDTSFYLDTVKVVVWCRDKTLHPNGWNAACLSFQLRIDNTIIGSADSAEIHPYVGTNSNYPEEAEAYEITWTDVNYFVEDSIVIAFYYTIPESLRDTNYYFFAFRGSNDDLFGNGFEDNHYAIYNLPSVSSTWNANYRVYDNTGFQLVTALGGYYEDASNSPPAKPSKPSGPSTGYTGQSYSFSTSTTDPDGDQIKYGWDWNGDGAVDSWSDFKNSGATHTKSHTFTYEGTFNIKVIAADSDGAQSSFSNEKTITISTQNENNPPNQPSNPSPSNGAVDLELSTDLSWSCSDSDGDSLTYDVYFGTDSTPDSSELVSNDQTQKTFDTGILTGSTTYYWKVVADDGQESISSSVWSFTTKAVGNRAPDTPSKPSGPSSANKGENICFTTATTDPDGDELFYWFDWGDGTNSYWIGSYYSGDTVYKHNSWSVPGTYNIKVKAKDPEGAESDWSDSLQVVITQGTLEHFAVIICGGGGEDDEVQEWFDRDSDRAEETFRNLGYDSSHIIRRRHIDMMDLNNIFVELSNNPNIGKLFIYFTSHGNVTNDGEGWLSLNPDEEELTENELDNMLKNIECLESLTIAIDCCYSGAFINGLIDDPYENNRIIITVTDEDNVGWSNVFYYSFFPALYTNNYLYQVRGSYGDAWRAMKEYSKTKCYEGVPQLGQKGVDPHKTYPGYSKDDSVSKNKLGYIFERISSQMPILKNILREKFPMLHRIIDLVQPLNQRNVLKLS